MSKFLRLRLVSVKYSGESIGRDVEVEVEALGQVLRVDKRIKVGETKKFSQEIARKELIGDFVSPNIAITVIEKDLFFNDTGKLKGSLGIDLALIEPQLFSFEVGVKESRSIFSWLFWGKRVAIFEIEVEAEVIKIEKANESEFGRIALYFDIDPEVQTANLRLEASDSGNVLKKIPNGEEVVIVKKAIVGIRPTGYLSDLWHKVSYQGIEGFVHSALIEVNGQEREKIIQAIKAKAKEIGIDEGVAINLAYCESKWLPFAHSSADNKGVYQLGESTVGYINSKLGGDVSDSYDPFQCIDGGLRYLRYLLKKYEGSSDYLARAIAGWNAGPNAVPYSGSLDLKGYDPQVADIVHCTLKEHKGESVMKSLKFLLLPIAIGVGLWLIFTPSGHGDLNTEIKVPRGKPTRYWEELALLAPSRPKGRGIEPLFRLRSDEMDNRVTHFASSLVVIKVKCEEPLFRLRSDEMDNRVTHFASSLVVIKYAASTVQQAVDQLVEGENFDLTRALAQNKKEVGLGYLQVASETEQNEKLTFTLFEPDPDEFVYFTNIYPPSGKRVMLEGTLWKAFFDDLTGDGVKELIVDTISGHVAITRLFSYKDGVLIEIPVHNENGVKPKTLLGTMLVTSLGVKFEDLDNDGVKEIILPIRSYTDELVEPTYYFRWDGNALRQYDQKNIVYQHSGA